MRTYRRNSDLLKKDSSLSGAPIYSPKHQCIYCGKPVNPEYTPNPTCYNCEFENQIQSTSLDRIHPISIYFPKRDWNSGRGEVIRNLRDFAQELIDAKEGAYVEKMSEILSYGLQNRGTLSEFDLIVIPPSSSDFNHMKPRAERLESKVDIPFHDAIVEIDDTGEMKEKDSAKARREAAEDSYLCSLDVSNKRVIIADDVVTTCSTMADIGRSLEQRGASQIVGLSITRTVDLYQLKEADLVVER